MSLPAILQDAEKIAADLVPPTNVLGPVVGVLIKQVEQIAGKELTNLKDSVLGVVPPVADVPPVQDQAGSPSEEQSELEQLKAQVAALSEREESLAAQVQAYQAAEQTEKPA